MAHFAEIDENNIVTRVLVTNNDDPNGDEGYQWLVDNFGGTWIKTSYNSLGGIHYLSDDQRDQNNNKVPSGKPHLRYNYAGVGFRYDPIKDAFIPTKPERPLLPPYLEWVFDEDTCIWKFEPVDS